MMTGKLLIICSGVFSTGATGAIAPVILRKRLLAPVILHMPYSVITYIKERQGWQVITVLLQSFEEGKLMEKFLLRSRACSLY